MNQHDVQIPKGFSYHPSGDPTRSEADIRMAKPLGITVHDHIIVGRDGHASFRGLQLI